MASTPGTKSRTIGSAFYNVFLENNIRVNARVALADHARWNFWQYFIQRLGDDSSQVFEADARIHAGTERAGFPFKFHCHFNGAAAGIDDGTDFHDSDLILLAGQIGSRHGQYLTSLDSPDELLGKREPHLQGALSGDPEQPVAFDNLLSLAHVAAGYHARKRRADLGLFLLQFKGTLRLFRVYQ